MSTCKICGSTENLENHHIYYAPEKTIPLCHSCHQKEHKKPNAPKSPWRHIFISLDDGDFEELKALKGKRTWEEFLVKPHLEKDAEL